MCNCDIHGQQWPHLTRHDQYAGSSPNEYFQDLSDSRCPNRRFHPQQPGSQFKSDVQEELKELKARLDKLENETS